MTRTTQRTGRTTGAVAVFLGAWLFATPAAAQSPESRYFKAVADYFSVSPVEVAILGEWDMDVEEVPVVLFLARRAGVPPDVVVSQRQAGASWSEVAGRYRMNASAFYVPFGDGPTGSLSRALEAYATMAERDWFRIELEDGDIVALVNTRFLSQSLAVAPSRVLAARDRTGSFVAGYDLLRGERR